MMKAFQFDRRMITVTLYTSASVRQYQQTLLNRCTQQISRQLVHQLPQVGYHIWYSKGTTTGQVCPELSLVVSCDYKIEQTAPAGCCYYTVSHKNVLLYFGPQLPCFSMDFYISCTNVNRNEYSTIYLLGVLNCLTTS